MTDEDCKHRIGEGRVTLMGKNRAGTELALAQADFVNSVGRSTLQALTIYLVINFVQWVLACSDIDAD